MGVEYFAVSAEYVVGVKREDTRIWHSLFEFSDSLSDELFPTIGKRVLSKRFLENRNYLITVILMFTHV